MGDGMVLIERVASGRGRKPKGDLGLAGEVGPEVYWRLEGCKGANFELKSLMLQSTWSCIASSEIGP